MSQVKMDSEDIAEIRNALQVIQLQAEALHLDLCGNALYKLDLLINQVKRIDKLLPVVNFEGVK